MLSPNNYKVLLLSAGYGTRLKPLTNILPKCLMPIRGTPLLAYWLQKCIVSKKNNILVNTHYKASKVREFLLSIKSCLNIFISHEKELLGTAGTIRAAHSWLSNKPTIIVHADNFSSLEFSQLISAHENARSNGALITMVIFKTNDPKNCGIVKLNDDRVVDFYEKDQNPPGYLANGAVYIFEPDVISFINNNNSINDISTQVIPKFLGKIATYDIDDYHIDIGNVHTLREAQKLNSFAIGNYFDKGIINLKEEIDQIQDLLREDII